MRLDVITLFPEFVNSLADYGIGGRALADGLLTLHTWNPRDYAHNRHRNVDARVYGGGPGMVMQIEPLKHTLDAVRAQRGADAAPVIYLSPQGERFTQDTAQTLAQGAGAVLLCGRYEGVDERLLRNDVDMELSVGDYVLSGGELPAMLVVDALTRLIPGALGGAESAEQDSFSHGLLEQPQYTRPEQHEYGRVPPVLLSGDHAAIERWRLKQALGRTWLRRPDLLDGITLDAAQQRLLQEFIEEQQPGSDPI